MKRYNKVWAICFLVMATTACTKKFEEYSVNPNQPVKVPASLILVKQLNDIASGMGNIQPWSSVSRYSQFSCVNYQYYGDNIYSFSGGPFAVYNGNLKNIDRMEVEAKNSGAKDVNPYAAIGKFLKSYYYYNLTSLMGDVPMKEALKGLDGNFVPKYDTQKEVFQQILKWLDEANDDFAKLYTDNDKTLNIASDIYYGGDFIKWRKLVNVFKLRILIALSKKTADTDLKVAQSFSDVIANPAKYPLFANATEDLKYVYNDVVNRYPLTPVAFGFDALRYNMAETYVKTCTDRRDPRTLITGEPAWKIVDDNGYAATDFRAFIGSPTGQDQNTMEQNAQIGKISLINRYRYYRTNTAENFILVGYIEMCFNIAEAINRGWTAGNAEDWYKKGIQASLAFYNIVNGTNNVNYLRPGQSLGTWTAASFTFDFTTYYNQANVTYETGAAGLTKILAQKYIAFFQNSGWEPYYNYRRTGVPVFSGGIGIGNNGIVPKRWTYPGSEQNINTPNWQAAVNAQFSGKDDFNGEMWIIK